MTDKTHLFRQVHPSFIVNGEIGVVTFRPNDADKGLLSVYDGDMITSENSHKHWTEELNKKSIGILAVTPEECGSVDLPAVPSPLKNFDSHAHIDFTACEKKEQRTKTKALLAFAIERNWIYQVEA